MDVAMWVAVLAPVLAVLVAWWPPKPATNPQRAQRQAPVVARHWHTGIRIGHLEYPRL